MYLEKVPVVIEIPKGCKVKYERDSETGLLLVDRVLKLNYPFNYGYIPNTLWEDGDPLDAIVIGDFELYPLSVITVTPIAVVKMYDGSESDYKVICALNSESFEEYWDAIEGFLQVYKKGVRIEGYDKSLTFINETLEKAYKAASND